MAAAIFYDCIGLKRTTRNQLRGCPRPHLTAGVVVPGGDPHPGNEAQDQHDEAEDDEAGGGVAGGPGLSVQQGAHGGHTEVLVTPLQQEVLVVRCSNVSKS